MIEHNKRDDLAKERTHLANERTLLAYWRTALAFLVLGAFLIKFLPESPFTVLAGASLIFGAVIFLYGTLIFFQNRRKICRR